MTIEILDPKVASFLTHLEELKLIKINKNSKAKDLLLKELIDKKKKLK